MTPCFAVLLFMLCCASLCADLREALIGARVREQVGRALAGAIGVGAMPLLRLNVEDNGISVERGVELVAALRAEIDGDGTGTVRRDAFRVWYLASEQRLRAEALEGRAGAAEERARDADARGAALAEALDTEA